MTDIDVAALDEQITRFKARQAVDQATREHLADSDIMQRQIVGVFDRVDRERRLDLERGSVEVKSFEC